MRMLCFDVSPEVRVWEGDQEEEVSLWAPGASPAPSRIRFVTAHHRPARQHHTQEKVRE